MKGDPKIILFRCPLKFNTINKPIFRYSSKEGTETCFRIIWEQKETSGAISIPFLFQIQAQRPRKCQ